jgi:hypothetical protein
MVYEWIDIYCFIELLWELTAIVVVFVLDVEALTWTMVGLSFVNQYYTLCILVNVTVWISSIKSSINYIIHGLWLRIYLIVFVIFSEACLNIFGWVIVAKSWILSLRT